MTLRIEEGGLDDVRVQALLGTHLAKARAATAEELEIALAHVAQAANRREGLEDVCWAVLNAKEFLFQH